MAKIKGINIEINANTSQLQRDLDNATSESKKLNNELKNVDKALKLDPTNTELLAQKQHLLAEAVASTKDKLQVLRQAQEEFQREGLNNENSEQYRRLQREIAETETSVRSLGQQQRQVNETIEQMNPTGIQNVANALDKASEKTIEFGNKVKDVGENLTKNLTVPLVAFGTATGLAFSEVDKGMDIIVTKTGATGKALEEMQKSAENIAITIPTSFEKVGTAIGEVNTRFGVTGEQLEELSTHFLKFAELNGVDVSNSIDKVQKVMASYGVEVEHTGAMLDTLNVVGQRTGISIDTLSGLLVTHSGSLQQMGFEVSQAANFLGDLEISGADTTQVLMGMQKAMVKASKDGKSLGQYLNDIGEQMKNAKTDAEGLQIAYEVFGARGGGAIYTAVKNGTVAFEELTGTINDNLGSVSETFETVVSPIDNFTMALNQVKLLGADLGAMLFEVLVPVLQIVIDVVGRLRDMWQNLSPQTQELIAKIGLILAVIGPLIAVIGQIIVVGGNIIAIVSKIITFVQMIIGFIPTIIAGLKALFAVLLANPIGLIIAAIVGLIAVFVHFYKNNEDFRNKVNQAWESVKTIVSNTAKAIWEFIKSLGEKLKPFADFIINVYIKLPIKMVQIGVDIVKGLWQGIQNTAEWLKNKITGFANGVTTKIKSLFGIQSPSKIMRDEVGKMLVQGLVVGVEQEQGRLNKSLQEMSQKAIEKAQEKAKDYKELGSLYLDEMKKGIKEQSESTVKTIQSIVDSNIAKINDKNAKQEYTKAGKELMNAYKSGIQNSLASIQSEIEKEVQNITEQAQKQYDSIIQSKEDMARKLADFGDLYFIDEETNEIAISNINEQIDAIKKYEDTLEQLQKKGLSDDFMAKITGMGVEEGTKYGVKLLSLSNKTFENYVGAWEEKQRLSKEIAEKFYSEQLKVLEVDFSQKLDSTMQSIPERIQELGKNTIQGMIKGMDNKKGEAIAKAREIADAITSTMQSALDIHSPSRVMRDLVGKNIVKGIEVGIDSESFALANKMKSVSEIIQNNTNVTNKSGDINLYIDKVYNSDNRTIQDMATELQFYGQRRNLK